VDFLAQTTTRKLIFHSGHTAAAAYLIGATIAEKVIKEYEL